MKQFNPQTIMVKAQDYNRDVRMHPKSVMMAVDGYLERIYVKY